MFKNESLRQVGVSFEFVSESARSRPFARNQLSPGTRGFSLVEVTIALGITAFAAMVLLAMMCSGMNSSRESADRTVSAQIAQQMIGMVQQTNWSEVPSLAQEYFYFDEAGQLVKGPDDFAAVFAACVLVEPSVSLASGGEGGTNDQLAAIRVRVVRDPSHKLSGVPAEEVNDEALRVAAKEFQAFVANNGS